MKKIIPTKIESLNVNLVNSEEIMTIRKNFSKTLNNFSLMKKLRSLKLNFK